MAFTRDNETVSRRTLLAGGATAAGSLIAAEALAQAKKPAAQKPPAAKPKPAPVVPKGPPVNAGIIGFGPQGRELAAAISRVPGANVLVVSDTYKPYHKKVAEAAPKATIIEDYRQLLERSDIPAIFVATPTHLHKDIVLAALQAGKHVYCEAPMAHTIDDARTMALAGKDAKTVFQIGQQYRANPQHHHVGRFMKMRAVGIPVMGRGQWHKRTTWSRPNPAMNWRLNPEVSIGLMGEVGIHSLDVANWFLGQRPVAVTGFSGKFREDSDTGDMPDTVHCVLEYPDGTRFYYDATLANSYEGQYELFNGTKAAVLVRDERAWMFKEADSELLGWEVYARKEEFGAETGISLVADASKQLKEGKMPGKEKQQAGDVGKTALFQSVSQFLDIIRGTAERVEGGNTVKVEKPDCGPQEGFQAVVTAIKAHEAATNGTKIKFDKEWFKL